MSHSPNGRNDRRKGGSGYEVGYGRPPRKCQFPKGTSGNPGGRPPRPTESAVEMADRLMMEKQVTTSGKRTSRMSVAVTKLVNDFTLGKISAAVYEQSLQAIDDIRARSQQQPSELVETWARKTQESIRQLVGAGEAPSAYADIYRAQISLLAMRLFEHVHGQAIETAVHLDRLMGVLEDALWVKRRLQIVNLPPQTLKTFACAFVLPIAALLRKPTARVAVLVQSDQAAATLADLFFQVASAPPREFPAEALIKRDGLSFHTMQGGRIDIVRFMKPLPGKDLDLCVIDDPQVLGDLRNPTVRKLHHDYALQQAVTSVGDHGAVLVVQSRLHAEDLSGLLGRAGAWTTFAHPSVWQKGAIAFNDPMAIGTLRQPAFILERTLEEIGAELFAGMHLQQPFAEGTITVTLNVCAEMVSETGQRKYAQETMELPVSLKDLLRYRVFGKCNGWVLPNDHPFRLSEAERERNRAQLLEMERRFKAGRLTRQQYVSLAWDLW
jgi:hypothetical protein